MTVEAACKRTRYVCTVPIYGGYVVSEDELNAARLGPKFTLIEGVKWNSSIKNTKIRWGRIARLTENGDVVIDDGEGPLTDEHIVEENGYRVYVGKSRPPKEEAILSTRDTLIEQTDRVRIYSQLPSN